MNTMNFGNTGGFPMSTRILDELQTAFSIFNALGAIAGDKTIISGCVTTGSIVSPGVVCINGEVLEFRGGTAQTKVKIVEVVENLLFEDNISKPVIKTRYVTFGTGVGAMDWVDFKAGFPTKNIDTLVARITALEARPLVGNIPIDLIALWGRPANEIPPLWVEYIGLAGRTPVGFSATDADFDVVGKVGGAKSKTLSIGNLPKHKFTYKKAVPGRGYKPENTDFPLGSLQDADTNELGNDESFSLLNPYRVVHFIQYKGV
ncbi:hypothetical protein [Flavobacterium soyangense]|uniref:Uncharacterized protein n=1 Tax=Flavobacterium soyangense TaxID=2023265 RepID=A0A930UCI3_9FLAO|nr:hypothetical protein [Flavobacterium soyangense]MBF2708791.1 hypothetical protein [Flavobacterium soyangense]